MEGRLQLYCEGKNLVCFERGESDCCYLFFVGGLGDGFLSVPFLSSLTKAVNHCGFTLVQPLLSSSYSGYGIASLQRDCEELDKLFHYYSAKRPASLFILCGHSTGCQDIVYFLKHGKNKHLVGGIILQAPVSDRDFIYSIHCEKDIQLLSSKAKELVLSGRGHHILNADRLFDPLSPMTADRFLSLYSRLGDDDMFSADFTPEEFEERLGHVECPALLSFSLNDEYVPQSVNIQQLAPRICRPMKRARSIFLPNATHNIADEKPQHLFLKEVTSFLSDLKIENNKNLT
jgi:pimeloyl-ACP methyl ester carboxylesterase